MEEREESAFFGRHAEDACDETLYLEIGKCEHSYKPFDVLTLTDAQLHVMTPDDKFTNTSTITTRNFHDRMYIDINDSSK